MITAKGRWDQQCKESQSRKFACSRYKEYEMDNGESRYKYQLENMKQRT